MQAVKGGWGLHFKKGDLSPSTAHKLAAMLEQAAAKDSPLAQRAAVVSGMLNAHPRPAVELAAGGPGASQLGASMMDQLCCCVVQHRLRFIQSHNFCLRRLQHPEPSSRVSSLATQTGLSMRWRCRQMRTCLTRLWPCLIGSATAWTFTPWRQWPLRQCSASPRWCCGLRGAG